MSSEKDLTIIEQKAVAFYGDTIIAVRAIDGQVYVPVKPICELLEVDWGSQYRRIKRDPVLLTEARGIVVMTIPQGSRQEMTCLPLKYISGFLFGINATRVRTDLQERLIRYQRECYETLATAFAEGRLTTELPYEELLQGNSPAVQAYKMAQAVLQMARQQILLEARLEQHEGRLGSTEGHIQELEERLETIEISLSDPARHITAAQASQISQAVKAIGLELGKRSGRNEFGGVYGELYRRFNIAGYRELPAARFDEAMRFLRDWYQSLTAGADVPF